MNRRTIGLAWRILTVAVVATMVQILGGGATLALSPPSPPGGAAPLDGPPGPELPTKQQQGCFFPAVLPNSNLLQPPPPTIALNLKDAWRFGQGAGATVAILDTGVQPNPRLPDVVAGGDYLQAGGNGMTDCDAHGTLVAGIIGAQPAGTDGFEGVAPQAQVISIRVRSAAWQYDLPGNSPDSMKSELDVRAIARAVVHAANMGAGVIDVSLPMCMPANQPVDDSLLSAAIGYAVNVRHALVIAAAGDTNGATPCTQNPPIDPSQPYDPRNWKNVKTISTPGWYSPAVLTVGFTTAKGIESADSLSGPWVSLAGPGTAIESLNSNGAPTVVNGIGSGGELVPLGGSSFAAAYVAGVAALLRSRFPSESPTDIADRLLASAHSPARGIDNTVGGGLIDPVAALSYQTAPAAPKWTFPTAKLVLPPRPRPDDQKPGITALIVAIAAVVLGGGAIYANSLRRRA